MKNIRKKIKAAFSFLLMCTLLPLDASAANTVTKEMNVKVSEESEEAYQQAADFAQEIKENGTSYQLQDVQYQVLGKTYLNKKEKVVKSELIPAGDAYTPEETIVEDGITYTLKSTDKEESIVKSAVTQEVTAYDDYYYAVTASDVPASKSVDQYNQATGKTETVVCQYSDIISAGTTVIENQMVVTFEGYDASYYAWNGHLISRNDDVPALSGYEEELLASVNAGSGSSISNIVWAGAVYTDAQGTLCRDAVATVQQTVPVYRVNYRGSMYTPEEKGTIYQCTYVGDDPDGEVEYEVKATATYIEKERSIVPYVLGGIGIVILVGLTILILYLMSKKKKETE